MYTMAFIIGATLSGALDPLAIAIALTAGLAARDGVQASAFAAIGALVYIGVYLFLIDRGGQSMGLAIYIAAFLAIGLLTSGVRAVKRWLTTQRGERA